LSFLLVLLIALSILTPLIPGFQIIGDVKAASSATITLDVSQGYVGDYVTVVGSGFTPNKDVTFIWGDQLLSSLGFITGMPYYQRPSYDKPGEVYTDALGNFIVQLQVPKLTSGAYTIKADDTTTSATATFTINPRVIIRNQYAYKKHGTSSTPSETKSSANYIELFLAEGFVGDWLAIQLSGFGEGEIVEVKIGTKSLDNFTVPTGTHKGYNFTTSAKRIPEMPSGDYTVTATGQSSGITASASFKVKPELFLSRPPPNTPALSGFDWVYTFDSFGISWYSSVNATANSTFLFEATGLTGENISSVSVVYDAGAPIECTVTGTLTIQDGSTQGIDSSTVPFISSSPFTAGLSPNAAIPSAIPSGKMLSVTITTGGTGGASFTFTNQLFSSSPGEEWDDGAFMWVEGDSTISSDGTGLSGKVYDVNKLAATGLLRYSWTYQWPVVATSTGSIVNKLDLDAIWGWTLTPYDQSSTPVSFYDLDDNEAWVSSEPVYIDYDNSGNVTVGDQRVTSQTINGTFYQAAWSPNVGATDPDLNRTLTAFPPETRPSYYSPGFWPIWVYLDKYDIGSVSEGDVRISAVPLLSVWWTWGWVPDVNGFTALSRSVPNIPGAGLTYDVGLWSAWATNDFSVDSTVEMEILASLEITSAPTAYQSTYYVTEGSDNIYIQGRGFRGNEQLQISVGGEYMKTVTPNAYGYFSTDIDNMPALAGGEQTITATGFVTASNTASTNITYTPALSVSPTSGYNLNPVTSIMVTGKGFKAGTYRIVLDGAGIGEAVTSSFTVTDTGDEAGQINIAFNLPEGVEGYHIVDVVETSDPSASAFYGAGYFTTGASVRANAPFPTNSEFPTVTIRPSLQRTPTSTTVGTSVTVTGKGLQPSTTYYIWYDPRGTTTSQAMLMTTTPATVTTNAKGTLTASFQVPQSDGDGHYIWVSTSNTFINNDPILAGAVYVYLTINEAVALTQTSGAVGASIAVSFSGLSTDSQYQLWWYKPEEAIVDGWSGTPLIPSTALPLATVTGALFGNSTETVSFTVPATAETGTVYAVDLSYYGPYDRYSELANPVFFTVGSISTTITISLTPSTVTKGESVAINGVIDKTISVNVTLFIKAPNGVTTNKTVTSTSSGTFTDSFTPDKAGTWQVWAKWDGNTIYAGYTSLAATVTVKSVDMSGTYMLTGLGTGIAALVFAIVIIVYYFMQKSKAAKPKK